jgi:hypothetical protein
MTNVKELLKDVAVNIVFENGVQFNVKTQKFEFPNTQTTHEEILKFLRLSFETFESLMTQGFKNRIDEIFESKIEWKDGQEIVPFALFKEETLKTIQWLKENYETIQPMSYKEAFELDDEKTGQFKAEVFDVIDIGQMIESMGHERICTDGKSLTQKKYDKEGNLIGTYQLDNVYEVHKVNGEKVGITEPLYAVKCWCTSTKNEHWIWIENKEEYINNPLNAIASTFRIHKTAIPHIKALKRQGDVLLAEMKDDFTPNENDEIVPLTPEQYFGLLEAQA